ncbi:MAG: hypothetical protein D6788_05145 [Planctomycetota bacterium]|nr:MAG: hypothetical protein D6788_05145 [Planctomycetota bacterium]
MSYYRAKDVIYGEVRSYVRVHLLNRQWMNRETGVKTEADDPEAVPVFKFNIPEEVPTQNYNYRYLTTVFLRRPDLSPFKMALSSQEWCGSTYKHLRWQEGKLRVLSFSYFPQEGERSWTVDGSAVPYEALPLMARDVAAAGTGRALRLMMPMRSNRQRVPEIRSARLEVGRPETIRVPLGVFSARTIRLDWDGPPAVFWVEAVPPYRLLRYEMDTLQGELLHVERRPYWDRSSKSAFYRQGHAP